MELKTVEESPQERAEAAAAEWAAELAACIREGRDYATARAALDDAVRTAESAGSEGCGPPFTDLAEILEGNFEPERPEVGTITGGGALLYKGRLNEIHGEPGTGKSNVSLAIVAEVLNQAKDVVVIDPEDNPTAIVRRLLSFGADKEMIRNHLYYLHDPTPDDIRAAIEWAKERNIELADLDGLAECIASQGLSERDETEVLGFFRDYVRPFAEGGAAVLVSDHVTKDRENRGAWSRGSGAKMGRYDGASYELRLIRSYSPEKSGSVKLVVAKDRNGGVGPKGTVAAEIHFEPDGGGTAVSIRKPESSEGGFAPTALMEKISREIEADPNVPLAYLRKCGKAEYVSLALEKLEEAKFLEIEKTGPGKANRYRILTPFREKNENE